MDEEEVFRKLRCPWKRQGHLRVKPKFRGLSFSEFDQLATLSLAQVIKLA